MIYTCLTIEHTFYLMPCPYETKKTEERILSSGLSSITFFLFIWLTEINVKKVLQYGSGPALKGEIFAHSFIELSKIK